MGKTLTIDIETIPDQDACSAAGVDPAAGFPPWPLHEILCVSILTVERTGWNGHRFAVETLSRAALSERAIVEEVERRVEDATDVLTFNGRGFDVPVLLSRAALAGVAVPKIARLASRSHVGCHADLLDEVTAYGAARGIKLAHLCAAFRIPVKLEAAGDGVAALAAEGDLARIARYCETDVVATWLAAQMWRSNQQQDLGLENWAKLAAWVRADQPRLAHLAPYAALPELVGGRCLAPFEERVVRF